MDAGNEAAAAAASGSEGSASAAGSVDAAPTTIPAAAATTAITTTTTTTSNPPAPVLAHAHANTAAGEEDADFGGYSTDKLLALADTIARRNDLLEAENELFDSFYARHLRATMAAAAAAAVVVGGSEEGGDGGGVSGEGAGEYGLPAAGAGGAATTALGEKKRALKKKAGDVRAGARAVGGGGALGGAAGGGVQGEEEEARKRLVPLSVDQKHELALKELDEVQEETEATKAEWLVTMDSIQAELEEAEVRLLDLRKGEVEFRRDIVEGALHERTGKLMAEKVVRWMEDNIREKVG
jgi:hypothetical protein